MTSNAKLLIGLGVTAMVWCGGCTEEISPQAQTPQASAPNSAAGSETGPMSSLPNQGGGSALGGAKRSATNLAEKAESASREVAGEPEPPDDDE